MFITAPRSALSPDCKRDSSPARPPSACSVTSAWDAPSAASGTCGQGGGGGSGSQRRGSLQLWQFLVAMLDDPTSTACIAWTGRGLEFKLVEPEEVRKTLRICRKYDN